MNHNHFIVPPGKKIHLKDYDPNYTAKSKDKQGALVKLQADVEKLAKYQTILYAQDTQALLIILQAMDTAGKDSLVRHVMSGINPQGCQVVSFKAPSVEELDHDYLWRCKKVLPERGRIGVFNRSYYEEVLVVRVHREILDNQRLPPYAREGDIWKKRYEDINNFEKYLVRNGTIMLKFFLNVSKEEQKSRLLARVNTPEKNWKSSLTDVRERAYWDNYMKAYENMLNHTSTKSAPWYVIPADNKWFTHTAVADIIVTKLKSLRLSYPRANQQRRKDLLKTKELLDNEPV